MALEAQCYLSWAVSIGPPNTEERRDSMKNNLTVDAVSLSVETVELEDVELLEESFAASSDNNNVVDVNTDPPPPA